MEDVRKHRKDVVEGECDKYERYLRELKGKCEDIRCLEISFEMGDISSEKNIEIVKRFELAKYAEITDKMPSKTPRKCKDDGDDAKKPLWNQSPLEPFVIGSEKSDFIALPFGF